MKIAAIPIVLSAVAFAAASDHNNLERGHPLRFDDAYSVAYRAQEWQTGLTVAARGPRAEFEYQVGFAKNQDLSVSITPGDRAEISYFHGLRREIGRGPAIAYRTGVTVDANHRPAASFRAIVTGPWHQYDRLHLNLDVSAAQSRNPRLGGILGYSSPLGYPRHFETTVLAEVGVETRWSGSFVGLGLRRQLTPTRILDVGVHAPFQLTLGLSQAF